MKKLLITAIFIALSGSAVAGQGNHFGYQNATADMSSTNTNTSESVSVSNSQGGRGGNSNQDQGQYQDQGQAQSNQDLVNFDDHSVNNSTYKGAKIPVSSAHAGPLVTSNNTCMGSSAAGVQALKFGFSIGSTWQDEDCVRRLDAAFLAKLGDVSPARALMCQKPNILEAYEAADVDCYTQPVVVAPVAKKKPYVFLGDMGK